ncbi:MAG: sigma-70 family RNA polymerase sigma factor [Pseudomonadota bacterium]
MGITGTEGVVGARWPLDEGSEASPSDDPAANAGQNDQARGEADSVGSETLMQAFASGDSAAFDQLYRRHGPGLFRFVYRHVGRQAQAEEIYQDTWLKVVDARRRYRPKAQFQTWLYRIAHHRIIDWYRKSRSLPLAAPEAVPDQPQTDEPTRRQVAQTLHRALLELPLEQRSTVLLHLERNLTLREIASICGCGRETVKSRMRYATARLRKALGGLYDEL